MSKYLFSLLLLITAMGNAASVIGSEKTSFDFRGINVAQAVQLIYSEALLDSYVIDPDVLTDPRAVSFRYDSSQGDLRLFVKSFFDSLGLEVIRRSGVDFVSKKQVKATTDEKHIFVYHPRFRDGSYLADLLGPLFSGTFTARRVVAASANEKSPAGLVPPGSAAASIDRKSDTLVFSGPADEVARLQKLLSQVDQSVGDVLIRGVLYEVQTSKDSGSAFSLALSVLSGRLDLSIGDAGQLGNAVRLKTANIDAALSALAGDTRFKAVSTPQLRVRSGREGHLTVGQDVPTLGAVNFGQGGQTIQSVEYRSAGVILSVTPQIFDAGIDLHVDQQISDFVRTETGVNGSPTLTKRSLTTDVTVLSGELIVLGGLSQKKDSGSNSGLSFLPKLLRSSTDSASETEVLLLLQVTKI